MTDPREALLNESVRKIMVQSNYDPHYSSIEERLIMETKLFLARWDGLCRMFGVEPATMIHMLATPAVIVLPEPDISDVYIRPECLFNRCPFRGMCRQDNRCRNPKAAAT